MEGGSTGEMTLAFSRAAVEELADPGAAFEEARAWSRHLGVVDNDPEAVQATVDDHDLPQDFQLDEADDVWIALERIRASTATPRHVYVGTTDERRRVANQLGWEYVPVREAAEKAEWPLEGEQSGGGLVTRLRETVGELLPSSGDG